MPKRRVALGVTLLFAVGLLLPSPASALPLVGGPDLPSMDPTQWVADGFKAILQFIIGDIDDLGEHLVNVLLQVPILTNEHAFPRLNALRSYMVWGAYGLLLLMFVISSLRYWLAGYSGSGAYEALTGFGRTVMAVVMLLLFVPAFNGVARAMNMFTAAIIDNPIVGDGLSKGLVGTLAVAPVSGGGIQMIMAVIAIGTALVLLFVKAVIMALLAVLFVASPFVIALWPLEETAWMARSMLNVMFALLLYPIVWALCFATFAVLSTDAFFPGSAGKTIDSITAPLMMAAGLVIAYRLPAKILELAGASGVTSSGVGRGIAHVRAAGYARAAVFGK